MSESFSATVCGAWSVAKQSITSMFCQRASTSSLCRQARADLAHALRCPLRDGGNIIFR
ncbi:MAG: hypothetical protein MZV64_58765 [Ignavibacteriales bacterium]|nr:hypothetical protein [Ignavibacteriales bacterium]